MNKMNILVDDMNIGIEKETIIKSKNVICPICQECIKMDIQDYNIFLYECKNGHELDNILLNEFEDKQKINYDFQKIWFFQRQSHFGKKIPIF